MIAYQSCRNNQTRTRGGGGGGGGGGGALDGYHMISLHIHEYLYFVIFVKTPSYGRVSKRWKSSSAASE